MVIDLTLYNQRRVKLMWRPLALGDVISSLPKMREELATVNPELFHGYSIVEQGLADCRMISHKRLVKLEFLLLRVLLHKNIYTLD